MARVQLWSDGFYATPGLSWDKDTMQGKPFFYFAYGAAASEVVVDTLTGEWKLLAAHVLHDAGRSLNPAIDIGQVEGAFIQGMGWLTMEELVWHPNDGSAKAGLLLTHAPSTYKIPTANDCPPVFDVRLWQDGRLPATTSPTRSIAARRPASRRCCCRSRSSSRSATRSRPPAGTASTRRSRRRRRARRSCARSPRSPPCRPRRRERAAPARPRRGLAGGGRAGDRRRGRRRARLGAARRRHADAGRRRRTRSARSAAATSS